MIGRTNMATRARAWVAMRRMMASCQGPRLRARRGLPRLGARWRVISAGRVAHIVLRTAEFLAALFIVCGLVLASMLARGPIRLVGMHDDIAASLQERAGDRYAIRLGPTYLMHDSWGVGLGFKGLTVLDSAGRTVLSAPRGRLGLDPFALALLEVRVRRLELDGLDLRLRLAADGGLSLAVANGSEATAIPLPGGPPGGSASEIAALVRAGIEATAGATQAMDRLTLANGHFAIDNEATGRSVVYDNFNVVFDHSGSRASAKVSATGPAGPWTINATASDGDEPSLSVEARDLGFADFQAFARGPLPVVAEGPVGFAVDARLGDDGALSTLTGKFSVGAGIVRINNPDAVPFFVDEATGRLAWDKDARRFRFDKLQVLAGLTQIQAQGFVAPPADDNRVWAAHLESRGAQFSPEREGEKPVSLSSIDLDAHYFEPGSRFVVDSLEAHGPTVNVGIKAEIAPDGAGASLKLDMTASTTSTPDLIRLWPQFINPDVRDWCAHNLHGGEIQGAMSANWTAADLDAMAHKRGLPRESLHGEFTTRGVGVDLMPGLPTMVTEEGSGSFTGRDFSVSGKRASMALSPTRRIQADNLVFAVPDTTPRPIVDAPLTRI